MPRTANPARQLAKTISQLQEQKQTHLAEIARIDSLFSRFGIQPQEQKRRGRPSGKSIEAVANGKPVGAGGRRGPRRTFGKSGTESILEFIKSKGKAGATTSEINAHWKSEGRSGGAYVTIGQIVKTGKLKRKNLPGERGSRYTVA